MMKDLLFWCLMDVSISWGYFACTDVFVATDVSARSWYSLLQMLFFRPMYLQGFDIHCCRCSFWNQCICNLLFFELADTFKPACHVQLHLHPTFLITWRCSPSKFCIFNALKSTIADIVAQYPLLLFTSQLEPIHYLQKKWYKKFERIWNGRWWHLERKLLR